MFSFSGKSKLSCVLLGAAVAGAMVMGSQSAQAEMDLRFDGASVPANGPTAFNYTLEVGGVDGGLANISTNDYFVIVGFGATPTGGPVSNIGSAWKITSITSSTLSTVSPAPAGLAYGVYGADNLSVQDGNSISLAQATSQAPDLLFQYTGISPISSPINFAVYSPLKYMQKGTELGYYTEDAKTSADGIYVPTTAGLPAGPLPLPATFWPGLGTLAAMALVGGVKLRKKFV